MYVQYSTTTSDRLSEVPLLNGQLIYLTDVNMQYFDMNNQRRPVTCIRLVDSLPSTAVAEEGIVYGIVNSSGNIDAALWDSTALTYRMLSSPLASTAVAGLVKPDGDSIRIDNDGTIHSLGTTYANATTSTAGLMSASDKTKLNGIASGATTNVGTVTKVSTGAGLTGGDITTSGTVKANLVSETKLTSASTSTTEVPSRVYPVALDKNGKLAVNVPWDNTTYSAATTSAAGLMSASDKTKLNGIATGATANTGTVTKVSTGAGLTGGDVTTTGTIKANLKSETKLSNASTANTETASRNYAVRLDKDGYLAVSVPWTDNNTDTKVTQTATTANANYEVLFSGTADNTTRTEEARKDSGLTFNPSTDTLTTKNLSSKIFTSLTGSGTGGSTASTTPKYKPTLWTFNAGITVANNQVYLIKIPTAGGSYGVWLSLNNGTNYYPVAVGNSSARFQTQYPANTVIAVTYESASVCTCYPKAGGDSTSNVTGCFRVINDYDSGNTTYTNASLGQGYATDTRSSAVAAVTASLSSYALTVGGIVSVKFNYDVPASATLNVNGKGAKSIYYKNAAITAGVIKAGDIATFIYSTQYHMISLDSAYTEISYQTWQNMSTAQRAERDYFIPDYPTAPSGFTPISYQDWLNLTTEEKAEIDYYIPDYPNPSNTAAQVSYSNVNSGLASTQVQNAIDEIAAGLRVLVVSSNSISALPTTLTHTDITDDMVVIRSILGTPSAQTNDWSITTGTGQLGISGTISGSTSLTLYLAKSHT